MRLPSCSLLLPLLFLFPALHAQELIIQSQEVQTGQQLVVPNSSAVRHSHRCYASAKMHPLAPSVVATREAVVALGVDHHRFVRCNLANGTKQVGAILSIENDRLVLSSGIMGENMIFYADLLAPPVPVAATGEHLANGLKWTGFVAVCVVAVPVIVALLPLMVTGVISD
jgi:hypothetical protein